jgi:hypothetical protein
VRLEGAVGRQRLRHLAGQRRGQAALLVEPGELAQLALRVAAQLARLEADVGLLGVALRADGHVLTGRHREGSGDQAGDAGGDDRGARRARCGHPEHEARGRHDAVVGAQHGGPQPVGAVAEMDLPAESRRARCHPVRR